MKDLYRAWINLLYAVVEMENAVVNDFGVRLEPMTHDETLRGPRSSPYKTQLLLQAHHRFRRDYLAIVAGAALSRLCALTAAVDGSHHAVDWMDTTVADLWGTGEAQAVARLEEQVGTALLSGYDQEWCVTAVERMETRTSSSYWT